jgi:hypothetical protein
MKSVIVFSVEISDQQCRYRDALFRSRETLTVILRCERSDLEG